MRIATIGDIHGKVDMLERVLRRIEAEGVDAILLVGDIAANVLPPVRGVADRVAHSPVNLNRYWNSFREVMAHFESWMPPVPGLANGDSSPKKLAWVPGNHDLPFNLTLYPEYREWADWCVHFRTLILAGDEELMVFGIGGAPRQFGWPNEWNDREVELAIPPKSTRILLTHAAARGTGAGMIQSYKGWEDTGVPRFRDWLNAAIYPTLHVHGHIHERGGKIFQDGSITSANAGGFGNPSPQAGFLLCENEDPWNTPWKVEYRRLDA